MSCLNRKEMMRMVDAVDKQIGDLRKLQEDLAGFVSATEAFENIAGSLREAQSEIFMKRIGEVASGIELATTELNGVAEDLKKRQKCLV